MVEKASEVMDSKSSSSQSEIGSAEDVVQALLDYLVAPMLPLKSAGREVPSLEQQQSVAKQVRAVVLLYNYYQRKRYSEVEFLGFESFCKLAVTLKPTLMGYLKLMQRSDYAELDDPEDQLSMTEKAIMDACDISLVLDASKDVPSTKGWPVSKVAVLLTDPSKEICVLKFGSIINGVWSIIEKDIDSASVISEAIGNGKHNKRKRNMKKPLREETNADEAGFQRLALSSVSEVTGINQSDLMVLESHVVYSLSKEKTAAHFYIMQSTQSIREDLQVPIKDVLESLQGPLVRKSSCSWTVTPVVEYFHVLPYAGVLTGWFSSKVFSNSLQNLRVELVGNEGVNSSQQIESLCDKEVIEDRDDSKKNCNAEDSVTNEANEINTESLEQRDINGSSMVCLSGSSTEPQNMDVDDLSVGCRQIENKSKSACNIIKVYQHQKRMTSSAESNINAKPSGVKGQEQGGGIGVPAAAEGLPELPTSVSVPLPTGDLTVAIPDPAVVPLQLADGVEQVSREYVEACYRTMAGMMVLIREYATGARAPVQVDMVDSVMKPSEVKDEKADTGNKTCNILSSDQDELPIGDCAPVLSQLNSTYLEKLQVTLASKENALSQTALKVLLRKRHKLSRQLRSLEDEIAMCDKNIQTILDGSENDLALKIEAIIDACNDVCLKCETETQDATRQHFEVQGSPQYGRRKRLSEAVLTLQKSCQELDDICYENNWTLATYHVSPEDGGFRANVTVKGLDFECSGGSDMCSTPRLPRDSAAAQMIVKLRNMASQSQ